MNSKINNAATNCRRRGRRYKRPEARLAARLTVTMTRRDLDAFHDYAAELNRAATDVARELLVAACGFFKASERGGAGAAARRTAPTRKDSHPRPRALDPSGGAR